MCSEKAEVGEVYVYVEHGVSPPILENVCDIDAHLAGGDDGEDADIEREEEEVSDGELDPEETIMMRLVMMKIESLKAEMRMEALVMSLLMKEMISHLKMKLKL